jgi:hypothetical protein
MVALVVFVVGRVKASRTSLNRITPDEEDSSRMRRNEWSNVVPLEVGGKPSTGYYVGVLLGTPKTMFNLMIDTGSSNTGIIANSDPKVGFHYQR